MQSPEVMPFESLVPLLRAVAARPALWPTALRLVPRRWWRRWPPLPLPPADYMRFRMETMYGSAPGAATGGGLDAEELIRYLEWCRRMARSPR